MYEKIKLAPEEGNEQDEHSRHIDDMDSCSKAIVSFSSELVYVMENEGRVRVGIKRSGKLDIPISTRLVMFVVVVSMFFSGICIDYLFIFIALVVGCFNTLYMVSFYCTQTH